MIDRFLKKIVIGAAVILIPVSGFSLAPGDQGYGIMLGVPTGITGKVWLDNQTAFDGALGIERDDLDFHLTFLWHDFSLLRRLNIQQPDWRGEFPIYFGVGPRANFKSDTEFGIRVPVGLSYLPEGTDWEVFAEFAPVLRLTPSTGFNGNYAIGARFYFKAIRPR